MREALKLGLYQAAAVGDDRHSADCRAGADAAAAAVGVAGGADATPAADIEILNGIRCAEGIHQPPNETIGIRDRGGRSGAWRQPSRYLDPTDAFPAGIGIALRARAAELVGQPFGVVDEFRRGAALWRRALGQWGALDRGPGG